MDRNKIDRLDGWMRVVSRGLTVLNMLSTFNAAQSFTKMRFFLELRFLATENHKNLF